MSTVTVYPAGAIVPGPNDFWTEVWFRMTIFGGAWMDLEAIGGVLQTIGDIFPFAHALDAMRDVMIDGAGFATIATDFYWVAGYTIVIFGLAVLVFRRRMYE